MTEGKRVIECDIENFVPVVAVTKQLEVVPKVISPAEGNLERDEEDNGKQSSSVEAHSSDALVGRPTSMRCHHHQSLPRLQPMRGETLW